MDRLTRFRINAPRVIHESFEHEIVIVNLDTGRYYCLQKSGVDLWNGIAAGASVEEIAAAFAKSYDTAGVDLDASLLATIEDLKREELIIDAPVGDATRGAWHGPSGDLGRVFEPPSLQTYTDMQDLLLLDPIHEVDEKGWPVAADPVKKGPADDPR